MKIADLIFTGFNGHVTALHRDTGAEVWSWSSPKGRQWVTLLLDRDLLVVSVNGYMYGLDAATGRQRWANSMPGRGWGVAALASLHGNSPNVIQNFASMQQTQSQVVGTSSSGAAGS